MAALVVTIVAVFALRQASKRHRLQREQQERHHQELREDERHASAVKECRERLVWVVDKATLEPAASEGATLGFGPDLALTVLQGLVHDAEQLDDATLAKAAAVQLSQFSLVLAKPNRTSATPRPPRKWPALTLSSPRAPRRSRVSVPARPRPKLPAKTWNAPPNERPLNKPQNSYAASSNKSAPTPPPK